MIEFGILTGKNIMAYGSGGFELDLSSHKISMIVGKNGASKSSIIEALTYCLYGKPYRKIKLSQLINTINGKALMTTLNFKSGSDEYFIKRGMKPNVFEIYKNGELIPEDSASKDYQKMLEEDIIGFGYKTFKQICVIGSSSYVQFMSLEAKDRRLMIEELLDSSVYSKMAILLKDIVSSTNKQYDFIQTKIVSLNGEIRRLESILSDIKDSEEKRRTEYASRLDELKAEREKVQAKIASITDIISGLVQKMDGKDDIQRKFDDHKSKLTDMMKEIENAKKTIKFFEQTDHCSVCQQEITETHKRDIIGREELTVKGNLETSKSLYEGMESLKQKLTEFQEFSTGITKANQILVDSNSSLKMINEQTNMIEKELARKNDSEKIVRELDEVKTEVITYQNKKLSLMDDLEYLNVCSTMLKDTGIKSAVVARYIPVINKLINQFLTSFDLFVNFELDENFNETIKSRYRDSFSYESFSEGERQRIDLSLLFVWRHIARMKNSASCNLLFFDETLDRSLDSDSIDSFLTMLREMENSNIFIITHRGADPVYFDRTIQVEKRPDGFSVMSEAN